MIENQPDITGLLRAWVDGDEDALGRLMACMYPELRRIARQHLGRRPPGHTLESAALANEAYLKLLRAGGIKCESRAHFLALCSQMTRRILVDHARGRGSAKRGGEAFRVSMDNLDELARAPSQGIDMLALHEALESLSRIDPRKGRVVELRHFGGLSVEEAAEALGISPETAKRDWRMAKAWLFGTLAGKPAKVASRRLTKE